MKNPTLPRMTLTLAIVVVGMVLVAATHRDVGRRPAGSHGRADG